MKIAKREVSLMTFLMSFKICVISTSEIPVNSEFLKVPKRLLEPREVACRAVARRVTTNPRERLGLHIRTLARTSIRIRGILLCICVKRNRVLMCV